MRGCRRANNVGNDIRLAWRTCFLSAALSLEVLESGVVRNWRADHLREALVEQTAALKRTSTHITLKAVANNGTVDNASQTP